LGHHHEHGSLPGRRLLLSIFVTLAFVAGEGLAGHFAHSLALLSDAGHNFSDALALIFSWYGIWIAQKPSTAKRTFGHHRVGILAALVNSVSLVLIAFFIVWEAFTRMSHPEPVQSTPVIVVAALAVLINAAISLSLRKAARTDLSVRSAYVHMVGDAVSAFGVVVAGVVVALTGAALADLLVSLLIALLILWGSWGILKESVNVLLEAIPEGMQMEAVEQTICNVEGVLAVHDLHVWTVGSGIIACSCHVTVEEQSVREGENVLRLVAEALERKHAITHSTVQVEVEGCEPNDMYCVMKISQKGEAAHSH